MPADTIVTVRMPISLLNALKQYTEQEHYSDLSEQIRSIVRHNCMRQADPLRQGLTQLENHMLTRMEERVDAKRQDELLEQLRKMMGGAR